jgi:hypothetical protein
VGHAPTDDLVRRAAVVDHYGATFTLGLTAAQKSDLIEFLKSL